VHPNAFSLVKLGEIAGNPLGILAGMNRHKDISHQ
jgi:hypothetical protein